MSKRKQLLYVIMSSSIFKERVDTLKKTWCKNIDYVIYSDHEDVFENIIKVSDRKDYHSNEEKHINMINSLSNLYDWYFFCDDDTFVNTKMTDEILKFADKNYVYGNIINQINNPDNPIFIKEMIPKEFVYLEGGAGYLINQFTINKIKPFINYNTGYADVSFGLNLYYNNVKIKDISLINQAIKLSCHFMKTFEQMNQMYNHVNK